MKPIYLVLLLLIGFTSCYNYEGPIREKNEPNTRYSTITNQSNNTSSQQQALSSQAYLETMAEAIKRTLPQAQVELLEDSIKVLFPDNIRFAASSIQPTEDIYEPMRKLARLINKFTETNILITGHTDDRGKVEVNKSISKKRADYIYALLVGFKVAESRLGSWGLGGVSPIASNDTEKGRIKNRRVEFVILSTLDD